MARSGKKQHTNRSTTQHPPSRAGIGSTDKRMWMLAAFVIVVALVAVAIAGTSVPTPAASVSDPASIAAGAALYTANCAECHGADLNGTATGPPFLNVIYAPNHHADEAFQRAVIGGVVPHHWNFGTMAPVAGLDRAEVALIVGFVRSEQEAASIFRDPSHG